MSVRNDGFNLDVEIIKKIKNINIDILKTILKDLASTAQKIARAKKGVKKEVNQKLYDEINPIRRKMKIAFRIDSSKYCSEDNEEDRGNEISYCFENFQKGKLLDRLAPFLAYLWKNNQGKDAEKYYERVNSKIDKMNENIESEIEIIDLLSLEDIDPQKTDSTPETEPTHSPSDLDKTSSQKRLKDSQLDIAMEMWREKVLSLADWNPVQLIFGKSDAKSILYQPVYLSSLNLKQRIMLDEHGDVAEYQQKRQSSEEQLTAMSVDSLFTVLESWSVLLGIPGSGKTSTEKWILRKVANRMIKDFDHAIYLPLADLSDHLTLYPNSDFYTFFFENCVGYDHETSESLGRMLRSVVESRPGSCLFLLDGLDEVATSERQDLINTLYYHLSQQRVIITSRPSASATLTLFQNLTFYNIVPFSPASIRRLVTTFSVEQNSSRSPSDILRILSNNTSLHQILLTPFLLVIACEILNLIEDISTAQQVTQTWLFKNLVKFMQVEYNRRSKEQLDSRDIDLLIEFAKKLSFDASIKKLNGTASIALTERVGIVKSRFLNEMGLRTGMFEFAHMRLQEFFGAHAVIRSGDKTVKDFIEHKAFTTDWLEEACFLVGLSSDRPSNGEPWSCLRNQLPWIKKELTGIAWLRLGQIVAASGVDEGGKLFLGLDIRDVLIEMVLDEHPLLEDTVRVLIEMDSDYFIKELWSRDTPDKIWEKIYRLIPLSVRDRTGLLNWVRNRSTLNWVQWMQGFGFTDEKELAGYRKIMTDSSSSQGDRLRAIQRLGWANDDLAIELMRPLVMEPSFAFSKAAIALAQIGGSEAANVLVDAIIASPLVAEKNLRSYSNALQLGRFSALEPLSRDRLVDWLVEQNAPYSVNTSFVLLALKGARLPRRGAEKICRMFLKNSLSDPLREYILFLIPGIRDDECISKLLIHALDSNDHILEKKILSVIPYLPTQDTQALHQIRERSETSNADLKLVYLELIAKSYRQFPNANAFMFVPSYIEYLLRKQNSGELKYSVALWRIAKLCGSLGLNRLAWEKLLTDIKILPIKSVLLSYLESQRFSPEVEKIEQLKECLKIDQTNPELRAYVCDALRYLVSRTELDAVELLCFIDTFFCDDMRSFSKQTVIEEAARNGQLIMSSVPR